MAEAGWYPDPGGAPGQYRYWDGQVWAQTTSPQPGTPPAEDVPPRSSGPRLLIVALIGLTVAAVVVWLIFFRSPSTPISADTNSARPSASGWDEQQPTSQPPIVAPEGGTLIDCPKTGGTAGGPPSKDGWVHGGGLKFKQVPGWKANGTTIEWIHRMSIQTETVYPGWFSMVGVGELHATDGFKETKLSAFQIMSCFATSSFYQDYTGRTDLLSESVTVGGKQGWRLRSEVHVKMSRLPQVKGDVVDVLVVEGKTPDTLGIFISTATIEDNPRIDLVNAAIASLVAE